MGHIELSVDRTRQRTLPAPRASSRAAKSSGSNRAGLANLHNARRGRTPVVNVVGDHSTRHIEFDSLLKSDIGALAAPVSSWVRTSTDADSLAADFAQAVRAAATPPGRVATLIIPADLQSAPAIGPAPLSKPLAAPASAPSRVAAAVESVRRGKSSALLSNTLAAAVAATLPEHAIVVDEGATSSVMLYPALACAAPHTWIALTGGAIGQGLPCATGAAIACPDRSVIAFQADGSGLYTLQALWTRARESLDVTTIICANRSYRILQIELMRAGVGEPGPHLIEVVL